MERKVFDIRDFGAKGDGITGNTEAIQACIDQCSRQGGLVLVTGGVYVCGTLYLKSNVHLHIDASAVLLASPRIADYGQNTHFNRYRNEKDMDRCWIFAEGQENLNISGGGMLNGNAEAFPNEGSPYRPMMFRFLKCRNIRLSGLRLYDAAAWTTAFLDSSYIWAEDLEIRNEKRYNGDGLDFDGCNHVFVRGCSITGTDDNLCLQAGSQTYPTEDVHISDCTFTSLCAGIRIGLKSVGTIRNVVISNCTMHNVWREGIKIECTEGGEISDISVTNIVMNNVARPLFLILNNRFEPDGLGSSVELQEMPKIGHMRRLTFSGITATDTEEMKKPHTRFGNDLMGAPWFNGIRVDAADNHKIEDLTLENIRYHSVGGVKKEAIPETYPKVLDKRLFPEEVSSENYYPDWSRTAWMDIRNVDGLYASNIRFSSMEPDERPPYLIEGCAVLKQEIFLK
ncbi:MAG: glycosyl hydrolase family 28 protein [Eubacteriales bacterium]|nr:glycosyl hydrolase family 28 protein [Eubacteriales bacterium]